MGVWPTVKQGRKTVLIFRKINCHSRKKLPLELHPPLCRLPDNYENFHNISYITLFFYCLMVTVVVMEHFDQKHSGKERVYFAYSFSLVFIIKHSPHRNTNRAGTWRPELIQRPGGRLLTVEEPRTTCSGMALPIIGWVPLHQLLIKTVSYQFPYSRILRRHFPN